MPNLDMQRLFLFQVMNLQRAHHDPTTIQYYWASFKID